MQIACENASVHLGGKEIVKQVSMAASNKQFVGVIGPNGSGKSTLLKCIYRVLKPSSGAILIDQKALQSFSVKESAKKIAVVSQHNYYNFEFTVFEVVLMGRSPHKKHMERDTKEDYDIVFAALKELDMLEYADRIFSTLSGGEQQRIILARALAQKTNCLVLDEPTNHLDIKYQLQLLNLVKKMNYTVIAALHDLNIAAMYCDYIYVLKDGEIKAAGSPSEVITTEMLKEIYEIDAKITKDQVTGLTNVVYQPR